MRDEKWEKNIKMGEKLRRRMEGQEMRKGKHQDVSSVGKMWEYKEKERKGLNSGRDKRKTKEGKRHRS